MKGWASIFVVHRIGPMTDDEVTVARREALLDDREIAAEMRDSRARLVADEQRDEDRSLMERDILLLARECHADERDRQLEERERSLVEREARLDERERRLGAEARRARA